MLCLIFFLFNYQRSERKHLGPCYTSPFVFGTLFPGSLLHSPSRIEILTLLPRLDWIIRSRQPIGKLTGWWVGTCRTATCHTRFWATWNSSGNSAILSGVFPGIKRIPVSVCFIASHPEPSGGITLTLTRTLGSNPRTVVPFRAA